ncbi:response regulator transcription factor [Williamsia sp. CHRR-6]|nr:response regulator transcription factor [Williamsia sp. CHRR-6]
MLVVEDSDAIREPVVAAFADAGFISYGAAAGTELESMVVGRRPDLVILDVMLPGGRDGFELIEVIRARCDAGIIMMTARDAIDDRLRGLRAGADDYVVKPFALDELIARGQAVLRRRHGTGSAVAVGDLLVDSDAGTVTRGGVQLDVTATELRLAQFLVAQRGRTVTKPQILQAVWGYDAYDVNLVEVHVSALRRKMEAHGPRMIHTVRGLGYSLRVDV